MANFNGYHEYIVGDPYHYNPSGIALERTTSVGSYAPNAWGLYDMHGNVSEWCQDRYGGTYPGGSVSDPTGPTTGWSRVIRGGNWYWDSRSCRSAERGGDPGNRFDIYGFRVVLAPGQP